MTKFSSEVTTQSSWGHY